MDRLMSAFYWPTVQWVEYPALTWLPVLVFGAALAHIRRSGRRSRGLAAATLLWTLYAAYETFMYFRSRQVIAPIRIDLIVLGPVMYAVTVLGALSWWRGRMTGPVRPE